MFVNVRFLKDKINFIDEIINKKVELIVGANQIIDSILEVHTYQLLHSIGQKAR